MSKVIHRQPVWTWSVVIVSTLLLSPVAATALMHALADAGRAITNSPAPAPRRAGDTEPLQSVARTRRLRAIRLDTNPEHPGTLAVLISAPGVLRVPDVSPHFAPPVTVALRHGVSIARSPRAPPA